MNSTHYPRLVSVLVVLGMLVAACGAPTPPPAESPTTAPPAGEMPSVAPPATEVPTGPVVATVGIGYEIASIDPATVWFDSPERASLHALYDGLIVLRGDPPQADPLLAERWESSDDLTEWTFYLSQEAVFHDGSPVTAEAVKWSWDRMMALQSGKSYIWAGVADADSLSVVDDYTVSFALNKPYVPFLDTLVYLKILNPAVLREHEEAGDFGEEGDYGQAWLIDHEAGSGPFTIERWEPGVEYVHTAVSDYWHGWPNGKHVDTFIMKVIREMKSRLLALQAGEVDHIVVPDATPEFYALEADPNIVVKNVPGYGMWMIMMNNQRGPTADVDVRKSIAYAFDYEGFVPSVGGGFLAESPLPRGSTYFAPQDMPTFDLERAREYLAQSEWPDGGFELNIVYLGTLPLEEQAALVLAEGLGELNINLNLVPKTWSEMTEMCGSVDTAPDLWVGYNSGEIPDPDNFLSANYNSANWGGWPTCHYYKNEQVEELLDEGASEGDPEAREDIYAQVQELVAADQPVIWFAQGGVPVAWNVRFRGTDTSLGPAEPFYPLPSDIYIEG